MTRQAVLDAATQAVMKDRNAEYAPPEQNFQRIADLWNTYLDGRTSALTPFDVAIMMVLVKVARTISSPHQIDHLVDGAGYFACAGDVMPDRENVGTVVGDTPPTEPLYVIYNGERGRLEECPDNGDYSIWYSDDSGKKARMHVDGWTMALAKGAAQYV